MTYLIAMLAVVGVVLNIKKRKECFYLWIFTNGFWCWHNARIGELAQAALFALYFWLAIVGAAEWAREEREER